MKNTIKLLGAIAILFPAILQAQSIKFHVSGKVGNFSSPDKAYLSYTHPDGFMADSSDLIDGSFNFLGAANSPRICYLTIGKSEHDRNSQRMMLCLEEGQITIISPDSLDNAIVTGGKLNSDYGVLKKALEPVNEKDKALGKEYLAASADKKQSTEFNDYLTKKRVTLEKEEKAIQTHFILDHPNSLISFITLKTMGGAIPDVNEIEPLFNSLSAEIRLSPGGKEYYTSLKGMEKSAVGAIAPDFTESDTSGKAISLHEFKGKYVLVDFWASWCRPCRAENPNVVKAFNTYKDRGFTVLGVSMDGENAKDKWIKAIKDDHVFWTQVSDLKGWSNSAAVLYAVQAIPQNFLVDPSGKIVAKNLRGDDLINKLAEIFGQ